MVSRCERISRAFPDAPGERGERAAAIHRIPTMKLERLICVVSTLAALASPLRAAEHPNMAGTWTIDAAKSDFGPMPVPADMVLTVKVDGPEFHVHQTGGGQPDIDLHFDTSGKEVTNDVPGAKMTSTHRWDGDVVAGEITIAADDGSKLTFKDRISYSPDGKVMTLKRDISGPMGDGKMTIVMNKTSATEKK
jgi:hypothetical protein